MWSKQEQSTIPPKYGCELIYVNATEKMIKDSSLPSDAYNVYYYYENVLIVDVCRGKKVSIFDMYYDKFGPDSITKIDWGYGKVNPKLWGYKPPEGKKKR